jgi:hypothetical protein
LQAMQIPPFLPPVSDRLDELKRQRALAQQQVEWFDREIATATGVMPAVATLLEPKPAPGGTPPAPAPAAANIPQAAADIMERYRQETSGSMAKDAKRGCLIAFVVGMVLMAIVPLAAYLFYLRSLESLATP